MKYNLDQLIDQVHAGVILDFVFFWGHHAKLDTITKACFSQWFPAEFEVEGTTYYCAEQYMMAEKARVFGDEEIRQQILSSSDPKEMKALGRLVKNFDVEKWNDVAGDIVVMGNFHKFKQNPRLLDFLLSTGEKVIVEASPYDTIWGIGMKESDLGITDPSNWKGTNLLGFALMEVRDRIGDCDE